MDVGPVPGIGFVGRNARFDHGQDFADKRVQPDRPRIFVPNADPFGQKRQTVIDLVMNGDQNSGEVIPAEIDGQRFSLWRPGPVLGPVFAEIGQTRFYFARPVAAIMKGRRIRGQGRNPGFEQIGLVGLTEKTADRIALAVKLKDGLGTDRPEDRFARPKVPVFHGGCVRAEAEPAFDQAVGQDDVPVLGPRFDPGGIRGRVQQPVGRNIGRLLRPAGKTSDRGDRQGEGKKPSGRILHRDPPGVGGARIDLIPVEINGQRETGYLSSGEDDNIYHYADLRPPHRSRSRSFFRRNGRNPGRDSGCSRRTSCLGYGPGKAGPDRNIPDARPAALSPQ